MFQGTLILEYRNFPTKYGKWFRTVEVFSYESEKFKRIYYVPSGTNTDFASIPRGFLWLIDSVGKYGKATVLHDYLCESKIVTREEADQVFLEAMEKLEVSWLKRKVMYYAVRTYSILRGE